MNFEETFLSAYALVPPASGRTVHVSVHADHDQLRTVGEKLSSAFRDGVSRLEHSQEQAAKLLQRELQYQADNIVTAIESSSRDIVEAIQTTCEYLGGHLSEIRWELERQTKVSEQILNMLLHSLDNTSRQYWDQGVKCYEAKEYDMAKERFKLSLKANRTNHFAYQYLGFIALHENNQEETLKSFGLATKFAETDYHRALALSHLGKAQYASGDLQHALESAVEATQRASQEAVFWYECGVFHARKGDDHSAVKNIRMAIETDWNYWSVAGCDPNLDPIRRSVDALFDEMRKQQGKIAQEAFQQFAATVKELKEMAVIVEGSARDLGTCESCLRGSTVFAYRALVDLAKTSQRYCLDSAIKVLDRRIAESNSARTAAESLGQEKVAELQGRIRAVESKAFTKEHSYKLGWARGCLFVLAPISAIVSCNVLGFQGRSGNEAEGSAFLILFAVLFAALVWNPIMRAITCDIPAGSMRSEIPELEQARKQAEVEAKSLRDQEHRRLEQQLQSLRRQKGECEKRLSRLDP